METKDEKSAPREIGSNLTGAALKGKPGHERDIPAAAFNDDGEAKATDKPKEHIENTDALLGDVHPTKRHEKSQEQHNADQEE
ncbi:hypothetical protein [Pedobacter africanus]|uniref:Uncharacterized protein n=1 Tax=Pedobacter africanus TaxID=151894 RepID=A0A1W1ZAN3_9SPHI|nr:hypothetical protein [Pedobacter africanus]SMC45467.1 hypothetical protein SAMN04488524_0539 [Pedobacter africanus]